MKRAGKNKSGLFVLWSLSFVIFSLTSSSFSSLPGDRARENILASWGQRQEFESFLASKRAAIVQEYMEFLAIPNVAADRENMRRNALFIQAMLERRGVRASLIEQEGCPPLVCGELVVPGASKTLLLYAHYDGQPVNPSEWTSPPWKPVLRDGLLEEGGKEIPVSVLEKSSGEEFRLYARSASDDKAPIMAVAAALDFLRSRSLELSINVKFLFEGEEEAGSPHLLGLLEKNKSLLSGHGILLCDGPVHQTRRPQIVFGARGMLDLEMTVYGPKRALHSGHYGNWAPNPAALLANLLATMRDSRGKILIENFYGDVVPLTAEERQAIAEAPQIDALLLQEFELAWSEDQKYRLEQRIMLPAMNIRGLESGHVEEKAANAIPTEAKASVDFRLVPHQTPQKVRELVEKHFLKQGFHIVDSTPDRETRLKHPRLVKLEWGEGYPPARTPMSAPFAKAVVHSLEKVAGPSLIKMPSLGGSIPMRGIMDVLEIDAILLPIVNHDNNQHGPNENLRLQNLWEGIALFSSLFAGLGKHWL
ncbi:MAG: M20/M25/M40 family metallo-hydrolase [Clostridiales bacterium]|nr:M20/M25/M40 family metallo-hydrolase [Clostridiales bacterium]